MTISEKYQISYAYRFWYKNENEQNNLKLFNAYRNIFWEIKFKTIIVKGSVSRRLFENIKVDEK